MEFIFAGFHQDNNIRQFDYYVMTSPRTRTVFTVRADLALIRKYEIPFQELPLLCRRILEDRAEGGITGAVTFTEDHMRAYATSRKAAREHAAQHRKPFRKSSSARIGAAWRGQGSRVTTGPSSR